RIRRAHHQLAEPVGSDILIGVIDQLHLETGRTAPDAPNRRVIGEFPTTLEGIADLRHAEPRADPDVKAPLELLELWNDRGHHHTAQGIVRISRAGGKPE